MEYEFPVVIYDSMTSVISAGKSNDHGCISGEEVDYLPFSFVAP